MDDETLLLRRKPTEAVSRPSLDEVWLVHSAGAWPQCLSLRREDLYEERV